MEELKELYQEVILDHNHSPKNYGKLNNASHYAEGDNPLCGDHINIYLVVEGDKIQDIRFEGKGCAISKASASLMTTEVKGKTIKETKNLFDKFHKLITENNDGLPDIDMPGKTVVFAGVREFPMRVKCAALAWHTLNEALTRSNHIVTTE